MGKAALDESTPTFCGIYAGSATEASVRERVESSDLVLTVGSIKSDFNTAGFTYHVSQLHTIDFHSNTIKIKFSEYPGMRMNGVLRALSRRLKDEKISLNIVPGPAGPHQPNVITMPKTEENQVITHKWLWPRLGHWLKPRDLVVTETGTANFGIMGTKFPPGAHSITQYLWGSIGYATGAAQGAALAAKELGIPRTILWTGDGSLQLTAQSISTMLRNELAPILFIICNKGYTIERLIHGMKAGYNDVQEWRYKDLALVFGAKPGQSRSYVVKTRAELDVLFGDEEFSSAESTVLRVVEVHMAPDDAPEMLKYTALAAAKGVES
jgi:pyruvate decarboxylase